MRAVIPPVEASDQVHVARIRCPNAEDCPLDAVGVENMGTHLVVDPIMAALVEQVIILFTKKGNIVTNRRSFCCGQWAHVEALMGCGEVSRLRNGVGSGTVSSRAARTCPYRGLYPVTESAVVLC